MIDELREKHLHTLEAIYRSLDSTQPIVMDLPNGYFERVSAIIDEARGKVRKEWMDARAILTAHDTALRD